MIKTTLSANKGNMVFDKETEYWQKEYQKGNLDDIDMPGEMHAVLERCVREIATSHSEALDVIESIEAKLKVLETSNDIIAKVLERIAKT